MLCLILMTRHYPSGSGRVWWCVELGPAGLPIGGERAKLRCVPVERGQSSPWRERRHQAGVRHWAGRAGGRWAEDMPACRAEPPLWAPRLERSTHTQTNTSTPGQGSSLFPCLQHLGQPCCVRVCFINKMYLLTSTDLLSFRCEQWWWGQCPGDFCSRECCALQLVCQSSCVFPSTHL